MKAYPSITKDVQNISITAFDKKDGSQIRAEWDRKKHFHKFGSKTQLISDEQPFLGEAPALIKAKYEKDLSDIFKKERFESVICFMEFHGPSSFAGNHVVEPHDVTLFDVNPYKKGILMPSEYIKMVGKLDICQPLYRGNCNSMFVESVENGTLEGMTFEGVICKAPNGKTPLPLMFKVKNNAWIEKLKIHCKGNVALFHELA